MAKTVLTDAGFLVGLLNKSDTKHAWALAHVPQLRHPWLTCEAVLSEALFLLAKTHDDASLWELLRRGVLQVRFDLDDELEAVLNLMDKYADVPMSLADACLVRMSETLAEPVIVTTDADFRIYRRHSRQVIPCLMP